MLLSWAQRLRPTKPLAPVTSIFKRLLFFLKMFLPLQLWWNSRIWILLKVLRVLFRKWAVLLFFCQTGWVTFWWEPIQFYHYFSSRTCLIFSWNSDSSASGYAVDSGSIGSLKVHMNSNVPRVLLSNLIWGNVDVSLFLLPLSGCMPGRKARHTLFTTLSGYRVLWRVGGGRGLPEWSGDA